MELFVHGGLEALSADVKKSSAAGTNSPAIWSQAEEHAASTGFSVSQKTGNILTKTSS